MKEQRKAPKSINLKYGVKITKFKKPQAAEPPCSVNNGPIFQTKSI